jgi:hypothetical protein
MMLLLAIALAQAPAPPVTVCDPSVTSKCVTTTKSGTKQLFDVNVVAGGGGGVIDGGTVGVTQVTSPWAVSAASLPLPSGAATDANLTILLDGGVAALNTIAAELVNGQQTTKVSNLPPAPKRNLSGGAIVDGSGVVQPVSASTLPLPTGAAQESGGNLAGILAQLAALTNVQMQTAVTLTQQPLNPFLQRCNQVRRTNCQP